MKVFEKTANITGCLEQMAWAWYDCEALPPWLRDMSERWAICWFWVTKWLQGEARQLWLEMNEEGCATVETAEHSKLFAPA